MYKDSLLACSLGPGITPAVFAITRKKNSIGKEAIADQTWIKGTHLHAEIIVVHLEQFVELWSVVHTIILFQGTNDKITRRLTESGEYSLVLAYHAQFV